MRRRFEMQAGAVGRMRRALRTLALCALGAQGGLGLQGCATPAVSAKGLELKRVVLYRNGVGYFEREGKVHDPSVTFRIKKDRVGDFLATLAVVEQGGSSVRSASFPIDVPDDPVPTEEEGGGDPKAKGGVKPSPEAMAQALDRKRGIERVRLSLDGEEHDLRVGYVSESPVWKPSYRLVLTDRKGQDGKPLAELQAWGIVQNLSGEDWEKVQLTLVAGAPLAFQSTLQQPVIPPRPVVSDQGEVIASMPTGEVSLSGELPRMAADASPAELEQESGALGLGSIGAVGSGAGYGSGGGAPSARAEARARAKAAPGRPARAPMPLPAPPPSAPSLPRELSALAAVAQDGGTTTYVLPHPVDVPDRSATMVLLSAKELPGQGTYLFAPDPGVPDSSSHPFRVARFSNKSGGLLERGPIAVFERSSFLGQGLLQSLPVDASATVPFMLERGLAVESSRTSEVQGARLALVEAGQLEIERDEVLRTHYTVKNGLAEAHEVLVKHPRGWGMKLFEPPPQTEDNVGTGTALVPVEVSARSSRVLVVDERRGFRVRVDPGDPLADMAVQAWLASVPSGHPGAASLAAAWDVRKKMKDASDRRATLATERDALLKVTTELRESLKAIEKSKSADDLRQSLTSRLKKSEDRLDEIKTQEIPLQVQLAELEIRLRELLSPLRIDALAPKGG